jgi:DNA polymerase
MGMGFPKQELKLIDLTLRMFIDSVLELDPVQLTKHLETVKENKLALLETVRDNMLKDADPDYVHAIYTEGMDGIKKLLMSNDKFAKALESLGIDPPTKISPATKKTAWAFAKTDEAFKALEEHEDERVQALVAARLGNKTTLEETRTERFISMSGRGRFPVPLRYYGAHSGRWSGQDSVNLQNLPARGANAGKIKKAIMAPDGYVVIDCDSAQIEARVLAWLAGQDELVQAFRDKQDVYRLMAAKIYGIPLEDVTTGAGSQRQVGKTVVLGAGYGVGHVKLQAFLKTQAGVVVSLDESKRIIDTYRSSAFKIVDFWRNAGDALKAMLTGQSMQIDAVGLIKAIPGKGLTLPSGLYIQYPGLREVANPDTGKFELVYYSKGLPVRIYGGKVVENVCQAVARQVVAEQMLRAAKRYKVVLTVHDAVAIIAKKDEAAEAQAYLEECMNWNPKWAAGLPLACESGVGDSYGDC